MALRRRVTPAAESDGRQGRPDGIEGGAVTFRRGQAHSRRTVLGWAGTVVGLAAGGAMTGTAQAQATPTALPAAVPARTGPEPAAASVREVLGKRTRSNAVALTIDDGPHPVWTPKVLDLLAEHEVRATFSVIGEQAQEYPRLVRRVVRAGHGICNHSMTHPQPFGARSTAAVRREIVDAQSAISDAAGEEPELFRSPGGSWTEAVLDVADELGLAPVGWSVDPRDWSLPGTTAIENTLLQARAGDIMLCHDGGGERAQTVAALGAVLPQLRVEGLRFVVL
jgi:peptidoglycan/xylan/chitin deacetylase (PgdA/CDA1 family)